MMAKIVCAPMMLALVITATTEASLGNFAVSHSAILEKFHPFVQKFSASLANKLGDSDNMEDVVYDAVTRILATQVDQLVVLANSTNYQMCCKCKKCARTCSACGKSCCCKGSGGCSCSSCVHPEGENSFSLTAVEDGTSVRSLWSSVTKELLVRELRSIVATHSSSANDRCCVCAYCKQHVPACGTTCCGTGESCGCKTCASSQIMQMDSVTNLVSLTDDAEAEVQTVTELVDRLVTVMAVL